MAAPSLRAAYPATNVTNWKNTTSPKTGPVTWRAGDLLVVVAGDANGDAINTPTLTDDLSQAVIFASRQNTVVVGSSCRAAIFTASPVNAGTAQSLSVAKAAGTDDWGWRCFVYASAAYDNSSATNNVAMSSGAVNLALTRNADNCCVVAGIFDWSASTDVTVTTVPVGATQDDASQDGTQYTYFVFDWGDQGAAGSTNYGLTNGTGTGRHSIVLCSIKPTFIADVATKPGMVGEFDTVERAEGWF